MQLQLTAGGYTSKEWYVVPHSIIEEAISRLIDGEKIGYDAHLQTIYGEK